MADFNPAQFNFNPIPPQFRLSDTYITESYPLAVAADDAGEDNGFTAVPSKKKKQAQIPSSTQHSTSSQCDSQELSSEDFQFAKISAEDRIRAEVGAKIQAAEVRLEVAARRANTAEGKQKFLEVSAEVSLYKTQAYQDRYYRDNFSRIYQEEICHVVQGMLVNTTYGPVAVDAQIGLANLAYPFADVGIGFGTGYKLVNGKSAYLNITGHVGLGAVLFFPHGIYTGVRVAGLTEAHIGGFFDVSAFVASVTADPNNTSAAFTQPMISGGLQFGSFNGEDAIIRIGVGVMKDFNDVTVFGDPSDVPLKDMHLIYISGAIGGVGP